MKSFSMDVPNYIQKYAPGAIDPFFRMAVAVRQISMSDVAHVFDISTGHTDFSPASEYNKRSAYAYGGKLYEVHRTRDGIPGGPGHWRPYRQDEWISVLGKFHGCHIPVPTGLHNRITALKTRAEQETHIRDYVGNTYLFVDDLVFKRTAEPSFAVRDLTWHREAEFLIDVNTDWHSPLECMSAFSYDQRDRALQYAGIADPNRAATAVSGYITLLNDTYLKRRPPNLCVIASTSGEDFIEGATGYLDEGSDAVLTAWISMRKHYESGVGEVGKASDFLRSVIEFHRTKNADPVSKKKEIQPWRGWMMQLFFPRMAFEGLLPRDEFHRARLEGAPREEIAPPNPR